KGNWAEELPLVLWEYRTSTKMAMGHTPFSLTYLCEAMLPVEVEISSHRRVAYAIGPNQELRKESLDLIQGLWDE
ncbi:hypothetical protein ACV35Z_38770, partial [Pseudomonas aeruginosa]